MEGLQHLLKKLGERLLIRFKALTPVIYPDFRNHYELKKQTENNQNHPENNSKPHWFRRSKGDKALVRDQKILKFSLGQLEQIKINQISPLSSCETESQDRIGDLVY